MTTLTFGLRTIGVAVYVAAMCGRAEAQLEPPRRPGVDPGSERSAQLASRAEKAQADFAAGNLSDRDLLIIVLAVAALVLIIVAVR